MVIITIYKLHIANGMLSHFHRNTVNITTVFVLRSGKKY